MSAEFRELLKKVGSGQHTHKDLTQAEAAKAMEMMLTQSATPAQIGAFLIAHRIKRPTGTELAGMLDTYQKLGPKLAALTDTKPPVTVLGVPYDGRTRTAPITPVTALILASAGIPTLTHGSETMPTKYGLPLISIWQGLGLDFTELSLTQAQNLLEVNDFTFVYTKKHFVSAQGLVSYREEIGKRPPLATLELIWSPYLGPQMQVIGYVHPPTENMINEALAIHQQDNYLLVKGLEGSCDLRLSQTNIIGVKQPNADFCYLKLSPREYDLYQQEVSLNSETELIDQLKTVIAGKKGELHSAAIWNGGFYLWRGGVCPDLTSGIDKAENLLTSGQVANKYQQIFTSLTHVTQKST